MKILVRTILAGLLGAAAGCFPASEGGANLQLRLPLGEMGLTVDAEDIAAYDRYVQLKQELTGMNFMLGNDGQDFYLGLYLACPGETTVSLAGYGDWLQFNSNTTELVLNLEVSTCLQGEFSTALYWQDSSDGHIELFTGTGGPYDLPVPDSDITLDAYRHPVGSAGCRTTAPDSGTYYFSAMDVAEGVIYPVQVKQVSAGEQVEFTIDDLAVGRSYQMIRAREEATAGLQWTAIREQPFVIDASGKHLEDACEPLLLP